MRQQAYGLLSGVLGAALLLAGCAGGTTDTGRSPRAQEPTAASPLAASETAIGSRNSSGALPAQAEQATPTPQLISDPLRIQVWWPDELYPADDEATERVLTGQFDGFQQTYSSYNLDVRRKRASGLGGILPTLRTALPVAPRAAPDLSLMRRSDLIAAAAEGLIVPLEDWLPTDVLNGLVPGTRALGEINGVLYGLPYVLNVYHIVYRSSVLEAPLLTFTDVLEQQPEYLFPAGAGQNTLVNWTLLLQYLAAGGTLVDAGGNAALDRDALLTVLDYYEQAAASDIFKPALLDITQFDDYWEPFEGGEASMVMMDTQTYLAYRASVPNAGLAPIPTDDGAPLTAVDGWMWVLTTQDPDRQRQARAFLSWMMRVNQHSVLSEALGLLPSQVGALRLWEDLEYARFAQDMLAAALIIPATHRNNSAAVALQNSLDAVLRGTPARQAITQALADLE